MFSILLQRTALRAPTTFGRVGLLMMSRQMKLALPRTLTTSSPLRERASTKTKSNTEKAEKSASTKSTKAAAAKKKQKPAAKKTKKPARKLAAKKPAAKKPVAKKKVVKKKVIAKPKINIKEHLPPKRPVPAYVAFTMAKKEAENRTFASRSDACSFMSDAAARWREMSAAEKEPYHLRARALADEYSVRLKEYLQTVPPDVLKAINDARVKKGSYKLKGPTPSRPTPPFLLFSAEFRQEFKESYTGEPRLFVTSSGSAAGQRWRNMSDAEKEPYEAAFRKAKAEQEAQQRAAVDAS